MRRSKEERLEIGRRIYTGELTTAMAAKQYNVNYYTARTYLRNYKAACADVPKRLRAKKKEIPDGALLRAGYEDMTREELIDELIRARINEERAKKGYAVRGAGAGKEFIPLGSLNMK